MAIYFQIIWNRLYIIFFTLAVTMGVAGFITLRMDPVYRTETTLLVTPYGLGRLDLATVRYTEQLSVTMSTLLEGEDVFAELEGDLGEGNVSDYKVAQVPNSELMMITTTDTDPYLAQITANTVAQILLVRVQTQYGVNLEDIRNSLSTSLSALENEIQALNREKARLLANDQAEAGRLTEIELSLTLKLQAHNALLTNYSETFFDQATQRNLISVFEEAPLPDEPYAPNLMLNMVAAVMAGVFGGLLLVFILELLRPRVYADQQIETILDTKVVGHIPEIRPKYRKNVFESVQVSRRGREQSSLPCVPGDAIAAESFRRLRTHIESQLVSEDNKSILFLSQEPHVGKSTIVVNFALAMARSFKRVLLVDCDMYQPNLHSLLGLSNDEGLSQILDKKTSFKNVVQHTATPTLDVLTTGERTELSAELLSTPQMDALIHELTKAYDCVILDSPPSLVVSDPGVLASYVGKVVFVVNYQSELHHLKRAQHEFMMLNLKLLGVVVNRVYRDRTQRWTTKYVSRT